jgi:hypothetical protein
MAANVDIAKLRNLGYLNGAGSLTVSTRQAPSPDVGRPGAIAVSLSRSSAPPPIPPSRAARSLDRVSPDHSEVVESQGGASNGFIAIELEGKGFSSDDIVLFNALVPPQDFVSANLFKVQLPVGIVDHVRSIEITIRNPLDSNIEELKGTFRVTGHGVSARSPSDRR